MKSGFEYRYSQWLAELDQWCKKHHGLTRKQAISILFEDSPYNPDGADFIVKKDLFWAESSEFYERLSSAFRLEERLKENRKVILRPWEDKSL